MAQTTYFLGIDFGTSGARACVIDHDTEIIWQQRVSYAHPDQQTAQDWQAALWQLLQSLPETIAKQVHDIALNGTSGSVLLCDQQLNPCSPTLLYYDTRATEQAQFLKKRAPEYDIVHSASSGLAKLLWLHQHALDNGTTDNSATNHACYALHQSDWLTALLTGKAGISDYHNALKTGYDVEKLCWPTWIQDLAIAPLLPEVYPPGTIIAPILPHLARQFNLPNICQIHAGTTDSTAAFIASGVQEIGTAVTSLGTTLVLKQLSQQRIDAAQYGIYSHRFGDMWLVGGASNAGAGVLQQFFNTAQLEQLSAQIDPEQDSPLDYYPLNKIGERFPVYDPTLAPRLTPRPVSDVDFLHGLLQSLAHIEANGYQKLRQLGAPPIQNILSNGGGAKSKTWQRIRERVVKASIQEAKHAEAAYGSALLAMRGKC